MIIPAYSLISSTLSILEIEGYNNHLYYRESGFIHILAIIISIIWVSGKVVNVLYQSSSIIHEENTKRGISSFVRSYLFVFIRYQWAVTTKAFSATGSSLENRSHPLSLSFLFP